jgi:putative transposase
VKIAPSTYYARKQRPASNRQKRDEILKEEISRVHANNYDAFGARKMHIVLNREPDPLGAGMWPDARSNA